MPQSKKRVRSEKDELTTTTHAAVAKRTRTNEVIESDDESSYIPSDSSSESSSRSSLSEKNNDSNIRFQSNLDSTIPNKLLHDKAFLFSLSKELKQQIDINPERFENSVLEINTCGVEDDHGQPWLAQTTTQWSGSGFVLEYNGEVFIMTNAHVAEMATMLTVRLADDSKKYNATVRQLEHECDLAVLSISDPEFHSKIKPLKLGEMLRVRNIITIVGFPRGGEELCITSGEVSRIEVDNYCHGSSDLLQQQVTAPINPGNSGGPAVNARGEVVGVAFQGSSGDGEGYIITPDIIKHFLDDIQNTTRPYSGFPDLAIDVQFMESAALRQYYGIEDGYGVLVTKVYKLSGLSDILKKHDILIALDGFQIKNDGTIETTFSKRISYDYLISKKQIGESIRATLIRAGNKIEVDLPLLYRATTTTLGGNFYHDQPPSYLIVSGIVLQTATKSLVEESGDDKLGYCLDRPKKYPGEAIVVMSHVFKNEYTKGISISSDELSIVKYINGVKIKNLHHALEIIEANTEEFHVIKTKDNLIYPVKNISSEQLLATLKPLRIDRDRSEDLLKAPVYKPGCPEYEAPQVTVAPAVRLRV